MPFKTCASCGTVWPDREGFLSDPGVRLLGYQMSSGDLVAGLFLFNHSCGTSLAQSVAAFADLHDGPVFERRLTGGDDCLSHCNQEDDLEPCPA